MSLNGDDNEKLQELINKTHKEQAVWFLNAFWSELGEETAEKFYLFVQKFNELDLQNGENGTAVDEMNAHRFLEHFQETMTVREMRDELRASGAITSRPKSVPLTHLLITKFKKSWHTLVNASQGDNQEEVAKAQALLEEVQALYRECQAADEKAAEALAAAQAAQKEVEAALAEVQAQEDAYNAKTESLKAKAESGGVVSRNKAKNELAQHLGEDPLPLRRAKITLEAAVKKAERTRKASEAAKEVAANALKEAQDKLAEAQAFLNEVKSRGGSAEGSLWWIDRELYEARKYKPMAKGGVARG